MPTNNDILTGRYQGTGRGFGFFIPDGASSRSEDCFIPPHRELGAWDGDHVEAALEPEGPALCVRGVPSGCAGPTQPGRRIAHITAILERGNPTVTGVIRKENRQIWLLPDNERLPGAIKLPGKTKVRDGERAAVRVSSYGTLSTPPLGTLDADFGPSGSRMAAVEAILYRQGVEREFPDEVTREAQAISQTVPAEAIERRLDLREELIITIDGAATKDIDDAISLKREGENWLLGVHIADVSHYVLPGSALDEEAFSRGTSVYFADQVVPMLPVALSNGICSLNPGVDRLALSCLMTLNKSGEVVSHSIAASVICSKERMTYEDCNLLLDSSREGDPLRASLAEKYAHILPMLRDMAELSRRLEKRRMDRGSLDLETQESYILCDSLGKPVDILPRSQGVSEKLIESFMLAANETVAHHLFDLHAPAVYRIHEKPSQDKLDTLRAMLSPLGLTVKDGSAHSLQKVLNAVKGKPEAPAVGMMVLRSMMKARYSTENLGHFGLAAPYYCHFTSPIRRYPDLMVHRCLHALLSHAGTKQLGRLRKSCESAAVQSSQREIAAQTAERDIDKLYFADYMQGHIGEVFSAAVSGATRFGLFAALGNGVEGFIPVETLPQDHYAYDEASLTLTGERTGRSFPFGMALEVICISADPGTGRIEFRLPDGQEAPFKPEEHSRSREKRPLPKTSKPPIHGKRPSNRRSMHVPKRGRKGKRR